MTKEAGSKDPLHGVTLEMMLDGLVKHYGWEEMGRMIRINCFSNLPSKTSSLRFLRRTPWAREKVEGLFRSLKRKNPRAGAKQGSERTSQ